MTSIEWTAGDDGVLGKTWNPCVGCNKISPGCKHCYAKAMHARLTAMGQVKYAEPFEVVKPWPPHLALPLTWKKGRRIFVNSMSDLFHEDVSDEYIAAVFGVMAACPQHTFQILTKRAERLPGWFAWLERDLSGRFKIPALIEHASVIVRNDASDVTAADRLCRIANESAGRDTWPLPNVWLGVSVEDQQRADERIPSLLKVPAAVRFLSCEPLLEPLRIAGYLAHTPDGHFSQCTVCGYSVDLFPSEGGGICPICSMRAFIGAVHNPIDWVIVGGESGHGARPFNLAWARSIIEQCRTAGVAVFMKQIGEAPIGFDGVQYRRHDKGGDPEGWAAELRVRQFPTARTT